MIRILRQCGRALGFSAFLLSLALGLGYTRVSAAVTVYSFSAQAQGVQIKLIWKTGTEIHNIGFNMLRSNSANGAYTQINSNLIPSQTFGGISGADYSYSDSGITLGQLYFYKLQSVADNGATELFGPVSASAAATPTATTRATATSTPTVPATATATFTPPSTATATATTQPTETRSPTPKAKTPTPTAFSTSTLPTQIVPTRPLPTTVASALVNPSPGGNADGSNNLAPGTTAIPSPDGGADPNEVALSQPPTNETDSGGAAPVDRSYYSDRLIKTVSILFSGLLVLGLTFIGLAGMYHFLRTFLNR